MCRAAVLHPTCAEKSANAWAKHRCKHADTQAAAATNSCVCYARAVNSAKLLDFLRSHRLAVQTSVSAAGRPQAAIVGFAVSDQFEIVFDTLGATRKGENLRRNPRIALVIGGWVRGDERTAQYEGEADEPSGAERARITEVYYSVYPDGRQRANWPGMTYFRVKPRWIRYSDYNQNPPGIVEFQANELMH
jgi:pyridoxine/pyridoxamine 5'-phosphate oxidase